MSFRGRAGWFFAGWFIGLATLFTTRSPAFVWTLIDFAKIISAMAPGSPVYFREGAE
jgi:hypothetical protein